MADDDKDYVDIREVMKKQEAEQHPSFWQRAGRVIRDDAVAIGRAGKSGAEWVRKEAPIVRDRAVAMYHKEQEIQAKAIAKEHELSAKFHAGIISAKEKERQLAKHYKDAKKELKKLKAEMRREGRSLANEFKDSPRKRKKLKKVV